MDFNIGRIRQALVNMNIDRDTLVVFLSDNGPEIDAGSAWPFRDRKRSLHEGGIRVPCMWQWKGTFQNKYTENFGLATDLFPTFLEAANITKPSNILLDGISLLSILKEPIVQTHSFSEERIVTWYKDLSGREAASWSHGFKVVSSGQHFETDEMYDMRLDALETKNIFQMRKSVPERGIFDIFTMSNNSRFDYKMSSMKELRKDPKHLAKLQFYLREKSMSFVKYGNLALLHHNETLTCGVVKSPFGVRALNWNLSTAVRPEY